MSSEVNKALARRIVEEMWNTKNLSEDFEYGSGAEGFKRLVSANRAWFPEGRLTIEDLIAEKDKVVTRYTAQMTLSALRVSERYFYNISPSCRFWRSGLKRTRTARSLSTH